MPVESRPDEESAGLSPGETCLAYTDEAIDVRISKLAAERYVLAWSDLVVNEWFEEFPSLPIAMVRMAALLHCGVHRWNRGLVSTEEFTATAGRWLYYATDGWSIRPMRDIPPWRGRSMPIDIAALLPGTYYDEAQELIYLSDRQLKCNWSLMCLEPAAAMRDTPTDSGLGPTPICQRCAEWERHAGSEPLLQPLKVCRHCRHNIHQITMAGAEWFNRRRSAGTAVHTAGQWIIDRTDGICLEHQHGHEPISAHAGRDVSSQAAPASAADGGTGYVYVVRLRHDRGTVTITVGLASTPHIAVDMVLAAENAPRTAVMWVKVQPRCDYCTGLATRYVHDSGDDTPLCDACARSQYGDTVKAVRDATGKLGISRYLLVPEQDWAAQPQGEQTTRP